MKEATHVWAPLRDNFKKLAPSIHLVRLENSVGNGTPDTNGCIYEREFWIELKVARGNKVELTSLQASWLEKRASVGGSAWVLARKGDVFRLWDGAVASIVRDQGWNYEAGIELELRKPWDWRALLQMVTAGRKDSSRNIVRNIAQHRARRAKADHPSAPLPGQTSFPGEGFPPDVAGGAIPPGVAA